MTSAQLLLDARNRAGLSQRALALRAGTAQSVVARIEAGLTSPTWDTLTRLLDASGFALDATLAVGAVPLTHMLADVSRILSLTPDQRLDEVANFTRFIAAAHPA